MTNVTTGIQTDSYNNGEHQASPSHAAHCNHTKPSSYSKFESLVIVSPFVRQIVAVRNGDS